MKTKRIFLIYPMLLVLALIFTACSNNPAVPSSTPDSSSPSTQSQNETAGTGETERQLKITLDDTDVIYATMVDTPAADIFAEQVPFTLNMDDYNGRNKRATMPFDIDDADLHNIQNEFESGYVTFYHGEGTPRFHIFYHHDGTQIRAGFELIARLDQEGIDTVAKYPGDVKVTVELSENVPNANDSKDIESATPNETEAEQQTSESKVLIAYFSLMGNTKQVAEEIQAQTGADIFQIIHETPYPTDYDSVRPIAGQEKDDNARPKLANHIENMDEYDVVFIGYPIWISTMPMPVYTFLEEYDFSGKTIIPFSTHRGSGLSNTRNDIEGIISGATLLNGLAIHDDDAGFDAAKERVEAWLAEVLK